MVASSRKVTGRQWKGDSRGSVERGKEGEREKRDKERGERKKMSEMILNCFFPNI